MKKFIQLPILATGLLLILLCMPGLIFYAENHSLVNFLFALLVPLTVFLIPVVIFHKMIRWYAVAIAIFILITPLAIFPVVYFGDLVGRDMLMLVFNTTYQEASELAKGYVPLFVIIYIVYIALTILAIKWLPSKISLKRSAIISVIALFFLTGIAAVRYGTGQFHSKVKVMIYTYYPFRLLDAGYIFYKQEVLINGAEKNIRNFHYKDVTGDPLPQRQIYVLLIGESSRYDHWEINGYSRPTSPLLMHQKRLLTYKDVAAAGCLTELSVPQIITGVTADHYMDHLHQAGIIRLFSQAGFKTFWLSTQVDNGNIRMHALLADSTVWMENTVVSNKHLHYDMDLVNSMKAILEKDTGKCFFIIHTMGSHHEYTSRYPKSFERFLPVWGTSFVPTDRSKKAELINAYDNTILYTDAVIDSAVKVINEFHCISALLYTSDHGENLFDDSRNLVLHAPNPPTKYIAHIPFFIYGSKEYVQQFPLKWEYLKEHVNNAISNNQSFSTLADMAGIKYREEDLHNSLADSVFINSKQLILGPNSKIYLFKDVR